MKIMALLQINKVLTVDILISVQSCNPTKHFQLETVASTANKLTNHKFRAPEVIIIISPNLNLHDLILVENKRHTKWRIYPH